MHKTIGQSQTFNDQLDPERAAALHATLSLAGDAPSVGEMLPPFWHQIYFWDAKPPSALGRDGHPAVGIGLIPDLGLPQRMWAGGRLIFDAPVRLGSPAQKRTTVDGLIEKQGKTGPLGFVTLRHEIRQNDRLCVTEFQDIVYRTPWPEGAGPERRQAPNDEDLCRVVTFDTTILFRYSALTFNGHRIHYDLDYARQVEGYDGLVVHGPLLAQLLVQLAREQLGELAKFSFRATAPLMHVEAAELCWKDGALWVRGPGGRLCMEATAS